MAFKLNSPTAYTYIANQIEIGANTMADSGPASLLEPRISLITLGVRSLETSLAFYRDILGWQPSSASSEDMIVFQVGKMAFSLYPLDKLAEDACLPPPASPTFGGITLAYCVREKSEVDSIFATLEKHGTTILKPAQEVFWGGYSGYFADPDGYPWEVAWNPFDIRPRNEAGDIILPQ